MTDPNLIEILRLPDGLLTALHSQLLHGLMQPAHYLIRLAHILSMALFFGGILLLDLRLIGVRAGLSLAAISDFALPVVKASLVVALASGVALFLYDPVGVGHRPYFALKLLLVALGIGNAMLFQSVGHARAAKARAMPFTARAAGAFSLTLWCGVVMCASFNKSGPALGPAAAPGVATASAQPESRKSSPAAAAKWAASIQPAAVTVRYKSDR